MVKTVVKVHDEVVRAKLKAAAPRILAQNRMLVEEMLRVAKPMVEAATPTGPGHFGYHGRDTIRILIARKGTMKTIGQLRAAVQLYWREKGTKRGERATRTAAKAVNATRRYIGVYYGGMARWWRL